MQAAGKLQVFSMGLKCRRKEHPCLKRGGFVAKQQQSRGEGGRSRQSHRRNLNIDAQQQLTALVFLVH